MVNRSQLLTILQKMDGGKIAAFKSSTWAMSKPRGSRSMGDSRSLLTQARCLRSQGKVAFFLLSWILLSVSVSWAALVQYDVPLKDRSGKQIGSFSYKE